VFIYIYTRIYLLGINNIFDFQLSVNIAYSAVECIQCYYVNYVIVIIIVIPVWISVSLKTLVKSYRNAHFWVLIPCACLYMYIFWFTYFNYI
jgi:hypothetical protein